MREIFFFFKKIIILIYTEREDEVKIECGFQDE